jgi:hypothetical protein
LPIKRKSRSNEKQKTDGFEKLVIEVIKVINKIPLCSSEKECTGDHIIERFSDMTTQK